MHVKKMLRVEDQAAAAAKGRSDRGHEAPRVPQVQITNSPLPHIPTTLEAHHNTT